MTNGGQHGRRSTASRMKSVGTQAALALGSLFASAFLASAAPKLYPGVVQLDYYLNIGGVAITDLTGNAKYPSSPDQVLFRPSAQSDCGFGDNYGLAMSGLFTPAADGAYTFYVSGDDHIELWLSSNDTPANLVKVAVEPDWNDCKQWITGNTNGGSRPDGGRPTTANVDAAQVAPNITVPIALQGGKSYLFRALLKEGGGGDGVGVTVVAPGEAAPVDGETTRLTAGMISVVADDAPRVLSGPTGGTVLQDGGTVALSASYYLPPDATATYQWFKNAVAIGGATDAALSTPAATADDGAKYKVRITVGTASADSSELVIHVRGLVEATGFAKFERFSNITGGTVAELTGNQKYIDNAPDVVQFVGGFEAPSGIGDNFGGRLSGLFVPPVDGDYVFYVSADDNAELWLSTDDKPENVVMIAKEATWANFREWNTDQGNATPVVKYSDPITLSKTSRYYLMGLYKEDGGGDNFAATFTLSGDPAPADGVPSAIVGARLVTLMPDPLSVITITSQPQNVLATDGRSASFSVTATATSENGSIPVIYQWYRNGEEVIGATGSSLTLKAVSPADNGAKFTAKVFTLGKSATTSEALLTVVADTFPPKIVSAGALKHFISDTEEATEVTVILDEPVTEASATALANYTLSAGTITAARLVSNSSGTDTVEQGVVLTATGLSAGTTYTVSVKNLADLLGNSSATPVSKSFTLSKLSWASIGTVADFAPAAFSLKGDTDFNLVSGGNAFWNAEDDITMVYESITGDFDRIAQVEHNDPSSNWARSGISARESLNNGAPTTATAGENPASRHQMIIADPATKFDGSAANNAFETNRRTTTGGNTDSSNAGGQPGPMYPNVWVRLKRVGQVISMYYSEVADNKHWRPLGSSDFAVLGEGATTPLAETLFVGPTFGPENGNIADTTLRLAWATRIRNYGEAEPIKKSHGAQTYSIGLAFGRNESGAPIAPVDVAGVDAVAQGNWNNVFGQNTSVDGPMTGIVADKNGAAEPTTVSVEWTSNNTWDSTGRGEENNKFVGSDHTLMIGYLDTGGATTSTVTLSDLPSALTAKGYDVYVYLLGGVGQGRAGAFRLLDGDGNVLVDYIRAVGDDNPSSFVRNTEAPGSATYGTGNYLVFSGITASKITVEATTANGQGASGTPRAPINAVQLIPSAGAAPTISVATSGAGAPVITFTGSLQVADNPAGPYVTIAGATSPLTITDKTGKKYYRASN